MMHSYVKYYLQHFRAVKFALRPLHGIIYQNPILLSPRTLIVFAMRPLHGIITQTLFYCLCVSYYLNRLYYEGAWNYLPNPILLSLHILLP